MSPARAQSWQSPSPYYERLRQIDEALARLAEARRQERRAVAEAAPRTAGRLSVYRVGGVKKLSQRIADTDPEGDLINGYSDGTGQVGSSWAPGHTPGIGTDRMPPAQLDWERPGGWGLIERNRKEV